MCSGHRRLQDVPVIEVLVKAGNVVQAENALEECRRLGGAT